MGMGAVLLGVNAATQFPPPLSYAMLGSAVVAPSALLVGWREQPFAGDAYFASVSCGLVGLAAGYVTGLTFWPAPDRFSGSLTWPVVVAAIVGQGLGAGTGYVLYAHAKPFLSDLDRLPEHPTGDPANWDRWKERRTP